MKTSKTWFITGSSRGLGLALAEAALAAGHRVAATARKPEAVAGLVAKYGDLVLPVALDVDSPEQADAALQTAIDHFGEIDVVVNNAGFGYIGALEEMSVENFDRQIATNFLGTVNVSRAVVPYFRRRGAGHLIQITSIGGRIGHPGLSGYQSAKFAVEGFSECLAAELAPLGVKLTIIEPGGFRTDWAGPSMDFAPPMEAYAPSVGAIRNLMPQFQGHEQGDPAKAAQVILKVAEMDQPPLRLPLGTDALAFLRKSYSHWLAELDRWEELSASTDFDGVSMHPLVRQLVGLD